MVTLFKMIMYELGCGVDRFCIKNSIGAVLGCILTVTYGNAGLLVIYRSWFSFQPLFRCGKQQRLLRI